MVSKKEHLEISEWFYERAKEFKKIANYTSKEFVTIKLGYTSLAIECLLVSDDHLLNWFLHPNEFLSRDTRHRSFTAHRKVRGNNLLYAYPSVNQYRSCDI